MTDEDITQFNDKVTEKLGKEQAATIADDIGVLITKHTESKKEREAQAKEIEDLRKMNEKLAAANAGLIHQISTDQVEPTPPSANTEPADFNLRDAFDEKGNFIK